MKLIDQHYLERPFYPSPEGRRMAAWLRGQGYGVSRKRARRLMRVMGLHAIYRRPRTSMPAAGHKIYPYLLRGMEITRPNQVWAADITYIPMARGYLYLVAIMDPDSSGPLCALLAALQHPGGVLPGKDASRP